MWSNLKKLIASGIGRRSHRRGDVPRFRAQLESLESRSMLSATIGVVAIDFEANTVTFAVWASSPQPQANVWQSIEAYDDAPRETRGASHGPGHPGGFGGQPLQQDQRNLFGEGLHNFGGNFPEDRLGDTTGPEVYKPPVMLQGTTEPKLNTASNSNSAPATQSDGISNSFALSARFRRTAPVRIADYVSALASPTTSQFSSGASTPSSLQANDAVFGAYGTDSLLLAADAGAVDSDDDRRLGDEFKSADDEADLEASTSSSVAAEEVAASLDALRRERVAIDEVLAELHEVRLREEQQPVESAPDGERNQDRAREANQEFLNTDDDVPSQSVSGPADGGMVLLEPSGDANSSAYDLSAAYLSTFSGVARAPLGVEASVGVYQSIDVGGGETPSASREPSPIAQPAAAARPSVSAENAPAKKSEQPT